MKNIQGSFQPNCGSTENKISLQEAMTGLFWFMYGVGEFMLFV
jgi:hypothetical protein